MAEPAIIVDDVSKRFRLYHERNQSLKSMVMRRGRAKYTELQALEKVSFEVPKGTTFGIIGHNGSGKSTMLKLLTRILRPDHGTVTTYGKVSALLELGAGFHPELSGRDNVYLNGSILGLSKKEIDRRYDEIVAFAFADSGQEDRIDTPVKNYSSGMYVKLGFSVAINVDPDLLLIDEVLTVGDEAFQRKCAEKFLDLKDSGKTIVIVSHSLGMVRDLCDQGMSVALISNAWRMASVSRLARRLCCSCVGATRIPLTIASWLDAVLASAFWIMVDTAHTSVAWRVSPAGSGSGCPAITVGDCAASSIVRAVAGLRAAGGRGCARVPH